MLRVNFDPALVCLLREVIPTLGALFSRGVPVQDPVLTRARSLLSLSL